MLDDEPNGWRLLQERAQREKDPKKLAEIIEQLNQLLTEHEKAAAEEERPNRSPRERPKESP